MLIVNNFPSKILKNIIYSKKFIIDHLIEKENDISYMFSGCKSLEFLPDISFWDLSFVKNIAGLFEGCSSLKTIPDISKWDISNVINISYLFYGCSSLISLPDISNWNTNKIKNLNYVFFNCTSLNFLPDISKWKINNVKEITGIFDECSSLLSYPDISKWNYNNSINNIFTESISKRSLIINTSDKYNSIIKSSEMFMNNNINKESSYNTINIQLNLDNEEDKSEYYDNFYN